MWKYFLSREHLPITRHSWKDADLTWSLISAITDDPAIKQGLFPSPGANVSTSKGGGKPKTDHQFALAAALFSEHPKYCEVFKLATSSKERAVWAKWIKNRLQKYVFINGGIRDE
jgi:hypothetical protein